MSDQWTKKGAQETLRHLRVELDRAIKTIQAEHRFKAAQGGAPCSCEYCAPTPKGEGQ